MTLTGRIGGWRFAKIRSWHAVSPQDGTHTVCGRSLNRTQAGNVVDDLPPEKSCESCLRIITRLQE